MWACALTLWELEVIFTDYSVSIIIQYSQLGSSDEYSNHVSGFNISYSPNIQWTIVGCSTDKITVLKTSLFWPRTLHYTNNKCNNNQPIWLEQRLFIDYAYWKPLPYIRCELRPHLIGTRGDFHRLFSDYLRSIHTWFMNHVINSNGTFKVKEFSTQKSKKYEISLDNHSIIIGDYSKIIRRLFK